MLILLFSLAFANDTDVTVILDEAEAALDAVEDALEIRDVEIEILQSKTAMLLRLVEAMAIADTADTDSATDIESDPEAETPADVDPIVIEVIEIVVDLPVE